MQIITTPLQMEDIEAMAKAGANAFIFGTSFFSVRAAAEFHMEQCLEIRELTKRTHTEMLMLVNRFFTEEELPLLKQHLASLKAIDVDGIIFSDDAVLAYAKDLCMEHKLIYQPDTLLTNHMDIDFYLSQGIQRAVLAKEITLQEMQDIASNTDAKRLEVLVHGRLAMMHSKRPLLSNYMEFCKQDISLTNQRNLWIEEATRKERMPILEDEHGTHVFSSFVQCSFQEIAVLQQANIQAIRIDGIFQTSEYLIDVIQMYRAIIDGKLSAEQTKANFINQYPQEPIGSGFYYQRTSKTK